MTPGSIWLAEGGGERRLVLVLSVDMETSACQVSLISNFEEAATDHDVILSPQDAHTPYSVVVQGDIVGPVLLSQLLEPIGWVEPELNLALNRMAYGEFAPSLAGRRGMPIRSRREARYVIKTAEVGVVHSLGLLWWEQFLSEEAAAELAQAQQTTPAQLS